MDRAVDFLVLHGSFSSLVLEASPGEAPLWRYWGPRLPAAALPPAGPGAALRDGRPQPPNALEFDQPLSVLPTFGVGAFHQSALLAHRAGRQFAQQFDACRVTWTTPQRAFELHLDDPVAGIRVTMSWALDAADVLKLGTTLTNTADEPLEIQWLAAGTLLLPGDVVAVRHYVGQWSAEFQPHTEALGRSLWRRENRRGRTSHDTFPGALVLTPGATADEGLVYGAHLGWSGNHVQTIEWLPDGRFQWQLGEWLAPGEVRLQPGESLASPTLFASCSSAGTNGLAAHFHAAVRARLPWPGGTMRPRPVHLNTWEAVYFDHREDDLRDLARAAARIGVERFVLDDGWFEGRHHDRAALGDWWPDPGKYPDGLRPLADHVRGLGMAFGLWVEPEMVNPDSQLYRAHPDWALQLQGRALLTGRNQLVLDIARVEVADTLFERLDALLREVPIDYLKWDMNRDLTTAGAAGHPAYRRQVHALYTLLDRVRAAHPAVEIESCSSGGARIDYGVLAHTHRVWTSDCNDALSRVTIQRGALQWLPPEIMGAHVGPVPAHTTGRTQALAFRAAVALPGHFGVEMDVRRLDASQHEELARWIALYKSLRSELHGARVWLGDAGDDVLWQAHGDPQAHDVLLFVYRIAPTTHRFTPALRLPMLRPDAPYVLARLDPPDINAAAPRGDAAPFHDALRAGRVTLQGAWLAAIGLPLPRMQAETALVVRLTALVSPPAPPAIPPAAPPR